MNDILTVSGLNKSYGDFSLKDVTFSLPEGCITGFIGVNGAGKTTTLRTLLGLTNKLSGKIQFFGLDMDKNEREIKDRIGIVLDGGGFYEELSLGEMKVIISSAYTSWSEQDFKRYMDMFSLDPKQKINSLSKGMRMKYALALALSHNAELLIMDEPTSGLDPLVRGQLLKILTEYIQKFHLIQNQIITEHHYLKGHHHQCHIDHKQQIFSRKTISGKSPRCRYSHQDLPCQNSDSNLYGIPEHHKKLRRIQQDFHIGSQRRIKRKYSPEYITDCLTGSRSTVCCQYRPQKII